MDVSFSAWQQTREESLVLKLESFAFLFDRRYTNRLNRMSRVFFEAYVKATKELATQEDRFPSLSEIDAKMESGAVYAFKDRLMKNTEFFEEVKISGVSYLVPHALRFLDVSGTYTDLAFDFEAGTVMLPTRRKVPAPVEMKPLKEDIAAKDMQLEVADDSATKPEDEVPDLESYPEHVPEPFTEVEEISESPVPEIATETKKESAVSVASVTSVATAPTVQRQESTAQALPEKGSRKIPTVAIVLSALVILLAAGGYFLFSLPSQGTPSIVKYSAYLSNTSNNTFLEMNIKNQDNIMNELDMMLPPDIDKSISAQGGIVTISHSYNTIVSLNSSHDASIRIYLLDNWTAVPVNLSLSVPMGFDSSVDVHGKDYNVMRKDNSLVLKFNCTPEGINFDQRYLKKR